MTEFKIDKDIPLPRGAAKTGLANALRQMNVGESILLGQDRPVAIHGMAKQVGIKITVRKTPDGYRIWRIEG